MLKLIFLGVNGSLQDTDSGNTSLLVTGKEGSLAVDLSCNLAAVVNAGVDAVILTHEHIDHVYGLPSLLHQMWIAGRGKALNIYVPQGLEQLADGLIHLFGLREKKNMFEIRLRTEPVFCVGTMKVTTFPTDHTEMSIGVVIEDGMEGSMGDGMEDTIEDVMKDVRSKLVYTCDTRPLRDIPSFMEGAQVLIHEASGLSKEEEALLRKGHSSGADAGKMARELGVDKLYLCHLPRGEEAKSQILREAKMVFGESFIPEVLGEIAVSGWEGRVRTNLQRFVTNTDNDAIVKG
ncbi:MBL fold metallo-hydrolase [Enterocloster citroniae]|uniref:MBL fold metallo-hydrolase n=1 Tax=Enterocloster citroniae TaxID=358743 RepID=UPI000E3F65C9|nr:MBL fold metallo-hydrolase [Enterocloster citroniae]RGC04075.1 MBL fold metallo-hydrolase [Enterocloster citroniae]